MVSSGHINKTFCFLGNAVEKADGEVDTFSFNMNMMGLLDLTACRKEKRKKKKTQMRRGRKLFRHPDSTNL